MSDSASNVPSPSGHSAPPLPPLPPLPPEAPLAASPAGRQVQSWGNRAWRRFGTTAWWRLVVGGLIVLLGTILLAIPFDSFRMANKIRSQAAKDALRTSLQHEVLERARSGLIVVRSFASNGDELSEIDSAISEIDRDLAKPLAQERFLGSLGELQVKIDRQRAKRDEALVRLNAAALSLSQGKQEATEKIREVADEIESVTEAIQSLEEQFTEMKSELGETQQSTPKAAPASPASPATPEPPAKPRSKTTTSSQTSTCLSKSGASGNTTTCTESEKNLARVQFNVLGNKGAAVIDTNSGNLLTIDLQGLRPTALGFQPGEPSAAYIRNTISRDVQKFIYASIATLVLLALFFFMLIARSFAGRAARGEQRAVIAESRGRTESHARQLAEARLTLMRAQVEPHFLFNTLAHVQALQEIDPPQASTMLEQLISYLRAAMPSMRDTKSTLGREIDVVRAYLELLKIRMGGRLKFFINVPVDMNGTSLPPTMIATLVENAIKHGLEPKKEGGSIAVQVRKLEATSEHPERMEVLVADDGLGFGAADTQGTGIGLANTRERLKMLYGSQAELSVEPNAPTGVRAIIRVPLVMPETVDEMHDDIALGGSSANVSPFTIQTVALLALCFGWLGVHRFYIGRMRTGFMQAALGMLSLLSGGVPVFVVPLVIWVVLDMVWVVTREFRDAHGRRIMRRDAQDRRAYSATQSFKKPRAANASESSRGIALLLAIPLGWTGAHRFYVGRVGTGLAMLFTLGGLGLWWLIDIVMVACGQLKDMDGKWVNEWE
jgi:TM2 domain-containing membrane protein YozV/signal transduction histidine kinase